MLGIIGKLADEGMDPKLPLPPGDTREQVVAAARGLSRRLAVWKQVQAAAAKSTELVSPASFDVGDWQRAIADFDNELGGLRDAETWRRYLLLEAAAGVSAHDEPGARHLARRMLSRMTSSELSPQQLDWLRRHAKSLGRVLRKVANEPVDYPQFLVALEQYELAPAGQAAIDFADCYQKLRWSATRADRDIAHQIDVHYRNANVRVAVSDDLMRRFMPEATPEHTPVRDSILGADVARREPYEHECRHAADSRSAEHSFDGRGVGRRYVRHDGEDWPGDFFQRWIVAL